MKDIFIVFLIVIGSLFVVSCTLPSNEKDPKLQVLQNKDERYVTDLEFASGKMILSDPYEFYKQFNSESKDNDEYGPQSINVPKVSGKIYAGSDGKFIYRIAFQDKLVEKEVKIGEVSTESAEILLGADNELQDKWKVLGSNAKIMLDTDFRDKEREENKKKAYDFLITQGYTFVPSPHSAETEYFKKELTYKEIETIDQLLESQQLKTRVRILFDDSLEQITTKLVDESHTEAILYSDRIPFVVAVTTGGDGTYNIYEQRNGDEVIGIIVREELY